MKKYIKLFMAFMMALGLAGCSSEKKDPKTVFIEASEKTTALEYQETEMVMTISLMGMEVEMPLTAKVITRGGQVTAMTTEMSTMGVDTVLTYVDDYIYMDVTDIKVKCQATFDDFVELNGGTSDYSADATMIESVELGEVDENGNQAYRVTLNEETVNLFTETMTTSLAEDNSEVELGDISYIGIVNSDGYLSQIKMEMSMIIKSEGVSVDTDIVVDVEYKNIGESFEITAPEDADQYEEYAFEDLIAE